MVDKVVAEVSNPESQTTGGETGAQTDTLDSLLSNIDKEFEEGKEPGKPEAKKAEDTNEVAELRRTVDTLVEDRINTDINGAVSSVQAELSDLPVKLPDKFVRGIINQMALDDPRLKKAFEGRHQDPARWGKTLKAIAKEIRGNVNPVDQGVTEDRRALAAAVRGTSTAIVEDESRKVDQFLRGAPDHMIEQWKRTQRIPDNWKG